MPCIVLTSVTHRGFILLAYMQRHLFLSFIYIYIYIMGKEGDLAAKQSLQKKCFTNGPLTGAAT